ncbi:GDSL-type esterase/lipase family protein [Ruminococcus sp.]|uniref:GDSL-type esterase/lipase family protein n=1 Tax=Ruminococcus sp. TaxID=41978 RepID=UPI00386DC65C
MKKLFTCVMVMLLSAMMLLSGCKSVVDKQNTTEAPAEQTALETKAPDSGYDETSPKSAEWFDSAVFVGDSVTLKLSYYCASHPEALGAAEFFCAGSLGYTNALWAVDDPEAVHPYYQGATHKVEDCCELTGKKNVFIMLGMNDIGLYGTKGAMDSCKQLVSDILAKTPDARIYIQSVTPMIKSAEMESFNNTLVKEFDGMLKDYCTANNYKYLDVFSAVADKDGNLPDEYCSDPDSMGLHFTDAACEMWANYLKNNA